MGLFSKITNKVTSKDDGKTSVETYGYVGQDGLTLEQADHLAAAYQAAGQADDVGQQVNAAARLLAGGRFQEAIEAWHGIGERYPERRAEAVSQIGAARYFLGDYEGAITDYVAARDGGFDADMMDDNVWEACEALAQQGDPTAGQRYLAAFPDGAYAKKAARL